jgi:hypothetical protein
VQDTPVSTTAGGEELLLLVHGDYVGVLMLVGLTHFVVHPNALSKGLPSSFSGEFKAESKHCLFGYNNKHPLLTINPINSIYQQTSSL